MHKACQSWKGEKQAEGYGDPTTERKAEDKVQSNCYLTSQQRVRHNDEWKKPDTRIHMHHSISVKYSTWKN